MIRLSHGVPEKYRNPFAPVDIKVFKGGEVNVVLPDHFLKDAHHFEWRVTVTGHLLNSDLVMAFFLTIDALRRFNPTIKIHAVIPYLPYARQDRVCNSGEALSVGLFAKLLNTMELESVQLLDPHSDAAPALIHKSWIRTQSEFVGEIITEKLLNLNTKNLWLVAPDAGAVKKTKALAEPLQRNFDIEGYITATKSRDLQSLEITQTRFDGNVEGKNLLVVDDICDGGRTFIELGKILRERGCGELSLFVTHGIFSYGVDELLKIYDRIYTTDSFHPDRHDEVRRYTNDIKNNDGISRFYWFQV